MIKSDLALVIIFCLILNYHRKSNCQEKISITVIFRELFNDYSNGLPFPLVIFVEFNFFLNLI